MSRIFRHCLGLLALSCLTPALFHAQTPREARATAALAHAAKNPLMLRAFLYNMPKGGELHFHLTGGVYAETILNNAVEDHLCISTTTRALTPNGGMSKSMPDTPQCPEGAIPVATIYQDQRFLDSTIDAWSMRDFVPSSGISGHDKFFVSGLRNGTDKKHLGEWVDEIAKRAAAQNVQYLEVQTSTPAIKTMMAAEAMGWNPDMPAMRQALLTKGAREEAVDGVKLLDEMDATRKHLEYCDTPAALPACSVTVRYLYVVGRNAPPARVFAQTLVGFELASMDPRVVGINFAQPEDAHWSMAEYDRQMHMLDYLHSSYPKVHITLHAGELAYGMVPPEGLHFHIREAVELGHAERVGHGVDIMYEDRPYELLKELAEKHVLVEINLTSNDLILGVRGKDHPLPIYLAHHVPIALSTDDEGVSRIDLTHEYQRAVTDFGLTYMDLKRSARASIEHSLLPGSDIWANSDDYTSLNPACIVVTSNSCNSFLRNSQKAQQQIKLENSFRVFETTIR